MHKFQLMNYPNIYLTMHMRNHIHTLCAHQTNKSYQINRDANKQLANVLFPLYHCRQRASKLNFMHLHGLMISVTMKIIT